MIQLKRTGVVDEVGNIALVEPVEIHGEWQCCNGYQRTGGRLIGVRANLETHSLPCRSCGKEAGAYVVEVSEGDRGWSGSNWPSVLDPDKRYWRVCEGRVNLEQECLTR